MSFFGVPNAAAGGSNASASTGQQSGLFGAKPATTGSGGLFGSGGTTGGTGGLFGGASSSSTPATGGGLFGGTATTSTTPSLFGAANAATSTSTTPAAPTNSLFGGPTTAQAAPTSLFGSAPATTALPASSTTPAQPASTNPLFGGATGFSLPKPADQTAAASPKPATSSFFSQPSTSTAGTTPATGGIFGQPAGTTPAPPATGVLGGGLFGKPATTPAPAAATPAPAAGGLFGPKPVEKKDGAAPATAFNLFGPKPDEKKDATAATANQPATKPAETAFSLGNPPSATPAVAVAPPSMLRGKTIEEIVNGWTAEFETQVKEFNKFASEVAVWDRILIENGNNLSALYSHVSTAEREQNDIDQSLEHIEQQQRELTATLDAYEKVTQEILGGQGGGLRALDTGPADTERDKNYMLATDLHTQLDDLSGSLAQMIDAVNGLSLPSDSFSADDPMVQISEILSSHLESLQWIDSAVREVETKISDVERRVKDSGHNNLGGSRRGFGLR